MLRDESASRLMGQTSGDLNRVYVRVLLDEAKPENAVTVIYRVRYPLTEAGEKMLVDSGRGFTVTEGIAIQGSVEAAELTHLSLDTIFDETNATFMEFFRSDRGKWPIKETTARPIAYGTSEIALVTQPHAKQGEYGIRSSK